MVSSGGFCYWGYPIVNNECLIDNYQDTKLYMMGYYYFYLQGAVFVVSIPAIGVLGLRKCLTFKKKEKSKESNEVNNEVNNEVISSNNISVKISEVD